MEFSSRGTGFQARFEGIVFHETVSIRQEETVSEDSHENIECQGMDFHPGKIEQTLKKFACHGIRFLVGVREH
jgi:hypothetical protein